MVFIILDIGQFFRGWLLPSLDFRTLDIMVFFIDRMPVLRVRINWVLRILDFWSSTRVKGLGWLAQVSWILDIGRFGQMVLCVSELRSAVTILF